MYTTWLSCLASGWGSLWSNVPKQPWFWHF